ncbi:MAG TPA: magnesium transporter [Longimicrobiales bacterium]
MAREQVIRQLARSALQLDPGAGALLDTLPRSALAEFVEREDEVIGAHALRRLRGDRASDVVAALSPAAASRILAFLEPAIAVTLVARMDEDVRRRHLEQLDPALADELRESLSYPPSAAGSIMDPRVESFRASTPVRTALAFIRTLKDRTIHDVFVLDDDGALIGSVPVQELALGAENAQLGELARPQPPAVLALVPQDELVALAEDRRVTSVAVVDVANRVIGVIRYPELLRATQRDASADIQTMVGVSREERALSPTRFAVRKRLPWLMINLATGFLAAAIVGLFESTIARFTALAVLMPVVAGQSGNTGAQALAVTMRGLALREIRVRHWLRIARKETGAGAINGLAVALVTASGVLLWSGSVGLAAVIGVAMVCSMIVAALAGASVPMLLIMLRQDPAAASSIVLTTVTDVTGLLSFLGFAAMASGML